MTQNILEWRRFHALLKGEIKAKWKNILKIFKNPLFNTTGPISTQFGTNHPWIDRIQFFTSEGPHPSSRGDYSKIKVIYGEYLKNFHFRTTGPGSTKLGIKHPWVEEIQNFFKQRAMTFYKGR